MVKRKNNLILIFIVLGIVIFATIGLVIYYNKPIENDVKIMLADSCESTCNYFFNLDGFGYSYHDDTLGKYLRCECTLSSGEIVSYFCDIDGCTPI